MDIATAPYELTDRHTDTTCDPVGQQSIAGDVEWEPEESITRTLIELQAEYARRYGVLFEGVLNSQLAIHLTQLCDLYLELGVLTAFVIGKPLNTFIVAQFPCVELHECVARR